MRAVINRAEAQRRVNPYVSKGREHLWAWAAELTGDKALLPPPGTYWRKGDVPSQRGGSHRRYASSPGTCWQKGDVYFIEAGDFIKIGISIRLSGRVREIKTHCPSPIKVIHHERGGRNFERELHRQFAHIRSHGEWFHKTPELLAFIESRKRLAVAGKVAP